MERLIEIPEDIDLSKITMGVILNPDGTFSHVLTAIAVNIRNFKQQTYVEFAEFSDSLATLWIYLH